MAPSPRILSEWGMCRPRQIPSAIAVHPDLDLVFVLDLWSRQIQSFRHDGTPVNQWNTGGVGMSLHPTRRRLFVVDNYYHNIQVFDLDGILVYKWGSCGEDDGQFRLPAGVSVHSTHDLVYIADMCNCRIQVFGLDGNFIRKWTTQDSNKKPWAPWSVVVHPTRDLIFAAEIDCGITAFRHDGTSICQWSAKDMALGSFQRTYQLTLHPTHDLLFFANDQCHQVQVFDFEGTLICKWGSQGRGVGEFYFPRGTAVDPTRNVVYVCDKNRVQTFSLFPIHRKRKRMDR